MFEAYYQMKKTPFSRAIPTESLTLLHHVEEVLGRLHYAAERQQFFVLTGDCGTGKSTIIRRFTEELDRQKYKLLYLSDSKLTPRHFYKGLLEQLGCEPKFYRGDSKRQLHREIELLQGMHGLSPVVVVDEAHLLDKEMLEEVRFLLNFKMDAQSPMTLILVGQSELRDKLRLQSYTAIRQRIDLQSKLRAYDRSETEQYILTHLGYAEGSKEVFTGKALDEIYAYTGGIPRMINKVCTHVLIAGAQRQQRLVDDHLVKKVIEAEF